MSSRLFMRNACQQEFRQSNPPFWRGVGSLAHGPKQHMRDDR